VSDSVKSHRKADDLFEQFGNFVLKAAPILFRFVEWAVVVGGLWFVASRAHSVWANMLLVALIGAWTLFLAVSITRWSDRVVIPHVRRKWLKLPIKVLTVVLAWGVARVAIMISADVTGASLSEEARKFFFMPSEEREWIQRAIAFERDSGARPPFPGQTVTGMAAGVASELGPSGGSEIGIAVISASGDLRTGVLMAELDQADPALLALLQAAVVAKRQITFTSCFGDLHWPTREVGAAQQPHGTVLVHELRVDGYTFSFPCLWVPPRRN
jgi:hypothetical protein